MNILLDMDGVLCNFVRGCCKVLNKDEQKVFQNWPINQYDVEPVFDVTTEHLWTSINSGGKDFWANLEEYSWSKELYRECQKHGEVYFLTSPSNDPQSLVGKLEWIQKFTGNPTPRNYLMGSPKFLCATPNNILIDDSDKNCDNFKSANGTAILFPQVWNRSHLYKNASMEQTLWKLEKLVSTPKIAFMTEGNNKRGGTGLAPTTPKQEIKPPAQKPPKILKD